MIIKKVISLILLLSIFASTMGTIGSASEEDLIAGSAGYDAVERLVSRLYLDVLNRNYDRAGLDDWASQLRRGTMTGGEAAYGFFFSSEFIGKELDNREFIRRLYIALLDRVPDKAGETAWVDQLNFGIPRENVFAGFVNSVEFDAYCRAAGIVRGTYVPPSGGSGGGSGGGTGGGSGSGTGGSSALIGAFVTRLYKITLQREPDRAGLDSWVKALEAGGSGAQVAYGFIFSTEMFNRNLTNDQFVEILYQALMGRGSDPVGKASWVALLRSNHSRYSIFIGFIDSMEFEKICRDYGIVKGTPPPPGNTVQGNTMVARIWNLITEAQFQGISDRPEHIAGIIGNFQAEAGLALCPFQQQVGSSRAGIGLMQWSFGRRINLENFMWNNDIDPEEFEEEMNKHLNHVCNNPAAHHPPELLEKVLNLQILFMLFEFRNTSEREYLQFIDFPVTKTGIDGARSYAELFCVLVERPGPSSSEIDEIQDEGVIEALTESMYGGVGVLLRTSYSGLEARRNRAANVYQQFLSNSR